MNMNRKFLVGFIQGLSGSGLWDRPDYVEPKNIKIISPAQKTDAERLHGDWVKIGGDFNVAINRVQRNIVR